MTKAQRYIEVGDRLLRRGKIRTAAAAYARSADAFLAETCLEAARACAEVNPLEALKKLAEVERLMGPSAEARSVAATAYLRLGQPAIAHRFLAATS